MNNLPTPPLAGNTTNNTNNTNKQITQYSNNQIATGGLAKEKEIPEDGVFLERVEETPELAPEVKKAGVEHVRGEIKLTPEERKVGIEEAAEAVPVSTQPTGATNLPLTDDQIKKALHQKITDSILWLATWCLRQIKLIHHKIRS